jgi:flavorubredoxin
METTIDEIAPDVFRLATYIPEVAPPAGFTFNQFVVRADEPFLFHTGMRQLFPVVSDAVARIVPLDRLRWIGFGHIEADECGALNQFLAAAPNAEAVHSELACALTLNDFADRPPRSVHDGEVLDLGGKRVRQIGTPHVPHGWEAQVLFEETTRTLFCGDLFTHLGDPEPVTTEDLIGPAMEAEAVFGFSALAPGTTEVLTRLADLQPTTLALMHGSSFKGDGAKALLDLAQAYDERYLATV